MVIQSEADRRADIVASMLAADRAAARADRESERAARAALRALWAWQSATETEERWSMEVVWGTWDGTVR